MVLPSGFFYPKEKLFPEQFTSLRRYKAVKLSRSLLVLSLFASFSVASAEMRPWKSSDGSKTLQANFLSRDETSVTLRRSDGRVLTFSIDKLHKDEQTFLEENHPYQTPEGAKEPEGDAFGPLKFGDTRNEVEAKLLDSSLVKSNIEAGLFGRTGLNGVFETTETIGGLPCFLYFDWTNSGGLQEVTLRTKDLGAMAYTSKLQATWNELINLLNKLYGKPLSVSPYPEQKELQDGLMLASHLWRTNDGHSVLLGTSQAQSNYTVSVRFTTKRIQPVVIP
ncbi:hypothetical protein GCM10007100_37340 [Roseibacillus persicicus]|uniref:SLA1 homology domain-containing protein n=1 Tax=Roseibacillus persicicus TaxID=454148 RepID=A0A918TWZ5_9BACT|nr:hypothetical protein GCM10007100_37340 [Roseibacillus persicicus]